MIWTLVVAVGLALIGCAAADEGDADPGGPSPSGTNDAAASNDARTRDDDDDNRPDFDPDFQNDDAGTTDPPKEDPGPGGEQCIDSDDARPTENLAKKLPDTDDCDNDYKTVNGVANGGVDVDMYTFKATDKGISTSQPTGCARNTDFKAETAGTQLCVYLKCASNKENSFKGCEAGSESENALGMKGCCASAPGRAVPKFDCGSVTDLGNDSAEFYMSVKQVAGGEKCLPYAISYRF